MRCNDSDTVHVVVFAAGSTESDADSEHERRFCQNHQEHHERYNNFIDTSLDSVIVVAL